jgi:rod shape-determining protein MreC
MNFYYHVNNVFKKAEFIFFLSLCIILLLAAKINKRATDNISMFFVDISVPIVQVATSPFNKIISSITNFDELLHAKSQNKILREENEKLKLLYIKSLNINEENKELKDLTRFVGIRSSKYHVARFIGYTRQIYGSSAFLDAGSTTGIKVDGIVIGKYSMVGRVLQVGENKARILLPTDITSRIPVITSESRTRGILAGNNTDLMEIMYLDKNHHITVGDMVYTSGDGDAIPPGILVGVVKKVSQNNVSVKMVEDINNLNLVSVIEY